MGLRDATPVRRFREFRWSRPFWGALFIGAGALVIGALPLGPTNSLLHIGYGLFAGEVCALVLLAMAGLILFVPSQRILASILAVLAALAAFPLSNLGGFIIGTLLGVLGGSLAFGWVPDKRPREPDPTPVSRRPRPGPAIEPGLDQHSDNVLAGGHS